MRYPLDITGLNPANRVTDEHQYVSAGRSLNEAGLILPRANPFFAENLEIWTGKEKTGTRLIANVDYYLLNPFVPYLERYNKNFSYGIWVMNKEVTDDLWLHYNALGGDYSINEEKLMEDILGMMTKHRSWRWEDLLNKPATFDPRAHTHPESHSPMPEVVAKFTELRQLIDATLT